MSGKGWIGLGVVAAAVVLLTAVHAPLVSAQAEVSNTQERVCLDCHRRPNINTNEGVAASRAFCFSCHGTPDSSYRTEGDARISLQIFESTFEGSPHRFVACVECHTDLARSPHQTDTGAQCRACHNVHGEGVAHAPHLRVACQACHYTHDAVVLDPVTSRIRLASVAVDPKSTEIATGHVNHALDDASDVQSCRRCHHSQNTVGAPASVLPAKSLLCIVCHPSPAAVGHPLFMLAGLIMLIGFFLMVRFWFIGSVHGESASLHRKISLASDAVWSVLFSRKILTVLKTLLLDIILQRRILKESVQRWSMHALIFIAILARFGLSLFTGLLFSVHPNGALALALIDKNHPFTAFVYDFLGLLIMTGIAWALVQRLIVKPAHVVTEIKDNITLGLIGLLVLLGFLTTGARILLTGIPSEVALHSFIGFPVSKMLNALQLDWRVVYPWLWYAHAAVAAAFIAYLPYGKLKHIFNVPLTYLLEEVDGTQKTKRV